MTDRREAILNRLLEICAGVPDVKMAVRNAAQMTDGKLPAIAILDADEIADDRDIGRGRRGDAPNFMTMKPEIHIVAEAGDGAKVGARLNTLRVELLRRVLGDAELLSICGTNGLIRYDGCETEFAFGRSMAGRMLMRVAFTYFLKPSEL